MNGSIYKIENTVTGQAYIGQTITAPSDRWAKHTYLLRRGKVHPLYASIRKYGLENFKFSVLRSGIDSQQELDDVENRFIDEMKATKREFGFNLEPCARGTGKRSESTGQRISAAKKGVPLSEEHKRQLRLAKVGYHPPHGFKKGIGGSGRCKKGNIPWSKGKTFTESHRKHLSESHKGKVIPEAQKEKIRQSVLRYLRTKNNLGEVR